MCLYFDNSNLLTFLEENIVTIQNKNAGKYTIAIL